jgi:hypothetical protein
MAYIHITALDDPAKPYKRVYLCEDTGIRVKVHAARRDVGFGKIKWDITGSLCGEDGSALTDSEGKPLIHVEPHGLSVLTDRGIRHADARDLLADLLKAESGDDVALIKRRARVLFETPPTDEQLEQSIAEDFERECLFMVAKVERATRNMQRAQNLGGVKPQAIEA